MKSVVVMAMLGGAMVAFADAQVSVTSVTARQRYPWNGLVDITVTIRGETEDLPNTICSFAATNSATKAAIPVEHITQNGDDTGSGTTWTRKYIWDAKADVGAVKIDDVALTVEVQGPVQLWENGPYWAPCNVGSTKPEECGYYFWWGDTVGYKRNSNNDGWISVKDGTRFSFSRGNCPTDGEDNSQLQADGYIDATGNLVAAHDAATAHLGAPWRMPTDAEFASLISNCTTTWTTRNGVPGRLVTGKGTYASKSIFLPAAGIGDASDLSSLGSYGRYWSSSPNSDNSYYAWYLYFSSSNFGRNFNVRYDGQSVRPVRGFANDSGNVVAADSGVTTHLSLDARTGMRLVPAGSTLSVDYSPNYSAAQDVETVRVLTNGVVWVESVVAGMKDFTFGDNGLYQFVHQVLTNGIVVEEMSAWYAVAETGQVDIPDTWTEIPAGLFKNCDWLTSVTIPSSVTNIGADAFEGCVNLLRVNVSSVEDWLKIGFENAAANPLSTGAKLYVGDEMVVSTGGDVPWVGETVEGAKIAASGEIGDSQESWLEVAIPGPAHVSFDWRVSCEESALDDSDEEVFFDGLEFLVDGETVGTIAGETDWATVSLDLTDAGPHAIRWRYFKDDASLEGDDGGAIANLVVTPYATVTFAAGGDAAGDLPEDVTCLVGTSVSLPSASSLAWAKHRFVGWSDGEAVYQPGAEYEVAEVETAFTAVWEEKRLATPTITVPAVFAADTIEVVISAESGASVYYTLDGSDPTDASPLYAEPFSVADDCTVRAIALRDDWFDSVVATATTQKATYTVRFDAGSCGVISSGDAVQTVKYGCAATAPTVGPDAWHAFDGWDKPFNRITGDLTVTANYCLAARAVSDIDCYVDRGVTSSETGVGVYLDDAAEDGCVIRMTEDAAWCAIEVEGYCRVSCAIDPEDVVCTVDGEERAIVIDLGRMVVEVTGEGTHEVRWTGKAQLSDFEVVSAALLSFAAAGGETGDVPAPIAMYEGDEVTLPGPGSLALAKHRFVGWRDGEAVLPPKSVYAGSLETKTLTAVWEEKHLAAPVIDAPEYFEAESAQVILNAEDGAEIRYTLDGTAPDASSALYEGPFAVGETVTIRAIALRDDWFDSAVAELQVVRGPWTFGEYLEMPEQTFSTSGDEEWVRAKGEGEDGEGSYALRSGAIGDSQESVLSMKIQGAGTVTFKYCVSSQAKKGVISDGLAVRLDGSDEKAFRDGGDTGWKEAEVSVSGAGEHTVAWVYWKNASGFDGADCAWLDSVKWTPTGPSVVNDPSAVVTGDAESGYVVVPSADLEQVEVELNGIDPSKVTVEVSVGVASVKPNGAKVKVVSAGADITEFLNIPAAVDGVIDLSAATVKDAVVTEVLDPEKGAVVELNSANPSLTTAPTKIGLVYQFREAATLEGFGSKTPSATKVGDGEPWALPITVKGGVSGFYSVDIGKGSASLP